MPTMEIEMIRKPEPCNHPNCKNTCSRKVCGASRCGGILFGTVDDPGYGCGRFFCDSHLVGHGGPAYCRPCWAARKKAIGGPVLPYAVTSTSGGGEDIREKRRVELLARVEDAIRIRREYDEAFNRAIAFIEERSHRPIDEVTKRHIRQLGLVVSWTSALDPGDCFLVNPNTNSWMYPFCPQPVQIVIGEKA